MTMKTYPWYRRILAPIQSACYWPSLRLFAMTANPLIDHFLVAGDEVEEVYHKQLGIHSSRITRYAYMVDTSRFHPPDRETRARMREKQGISEDAIVITLINRLDLPKGLFFALEGIALAQAKLSPEVQKRLKVIIAGDGPLRSQIETDIQQREWHTVCTLWGDAKPSDVVMLLGITDIFLYSGTRGTNYSMAVLEAMAAGCAVVASTRPQSNAKLLAEERGIAIMPGNAHEISTAITRLCNNLELCRLMGMKAREYVATYHTAEALRRNLLRTSFFVPQHKLSCNQQNAKPQI
jgi:glycosyltransferase involved in cell wall biosynthesis